MRVLTFRSFILLGVMIFSITSKADDTRDQVALLKTAAPKISIDPLSQGPLELTDQRVAASRAALKNQDLGTDSACSITSSDIALSVVSFSHLPKEICKNRTQELVFVASKNAVVACHSQKAEFAIKVMYGSSGTGKTAEGDRKSPVGTYWVGYPRKSETFGVFIPIGYPNMEEIAKGYTGSDIGLHGPHRFLKCFPIASLAANWTAGCLAMGRDDQVVTLGSWVLDNWPVKITMIP